MSTRTEFTATATLPYTSNGVTWASNTPHIFNVSGTVGTSNSFIYFYNQYTKPSWLQYDNDYQLIMDKSGTTDKVEFYFWTRIGSTWTLQFATTSDRVFNIPTDTYAEFSYGIRVLANSGAVDETVYPYVFESKTFTPRLSRNNPTPMVGNPYYSGTTGGYYALPNCTRYAYGRWWEIMGTQPHGLDYLGNAQTWWTNVTAYNRGQEPRLGAIICFAGGRWSGLGHVAVVEKIMDNGDILCSNSAYGGDYFYLTQVNKRDNYHRDTGGYSHDYVSYNFQGFIYLPDEYSPNPPSPNPPEHKLPFWMYLKRKPF